MNYTRHTNTDINSLGSSGYDSTFSGYGFRISEAGIALSWHTILVTRSAFLVVCYAMGDPFGFTTGGFKCRH